MKNSLRLTLVLSTVGLGFLSSAPVTRQLTASGSVAMAATAERTGTFIESVSANPTSLFPLTNNDGEAAAVQDMFFESLLDRHWDTYDWIPSLASKWEISKDGKQFTFTLDKKAKFSDGSPVTAEDVKFSYDIIFMKGVMCAHLRPYYSAIKKVEVLGPDKVRFTAGEVYYKNFDVVATLTVFPKKHYMKLYEKDNSMTKAEVTKDPLGSGQWLLDKWDGNQQITFKRNPNYWNKEELIKQGRWNYDRHIFKIVQEEPVEFEMFRKGDLTYKGLIPKQWAKQTSGPEFKSKLVRVKTVNKSPTGYGYIGWNLKNPILSNKDVRWALSHIADLKTQVQALMDEVKKLKDQVAKGSPPPPARLNPGMAADTTRPTRSQDQSGQFDPVPSEAMQPTMELPEGGTSEQAPKPEQEGDKRLPMLDVSEKGLIFRSKDNAHSIRLGGLLQLDDREFVDAPTSQESKFLVRRARPYA
ncbi:hypothetical protein EBR21_10065, partial [bacterium]|nr:hypothetical protein [bacterium]